MADTYWTLHKAPPSSPKKWAVRVPTSSGRGKTVLFGARGYEDFTTHGDVERRERYRTRHQHDRIDDPYAPGFWSMWALWGESDDLKTAFAAAVRKAKKIARRNPSPISTAVDEVVATDTYKPQVGDRHAFAPPGMYPFDAVVTDVSEGMATVVQADPGEPPSAYGVKMPAESVAHFANDLRGIVYGPPSDDPAVDAVVHGDAVFLGKGDDGVAFLVDTLEGPLVVKASTTVPFQPFNSNHLTPAKAVARLEAQQAASDAMAEAGIPGILPSQFVLNGEGAAVKGFMLKPWVEIPEHLTRRQLDEVAASVEAAHKAGWVFRDDLQVGLWDGHTYHFDTGKAEYVGVGKKSDPDDYWSDAHTDVQNLKRLFGKHGERYLTAREQQNPIAEFEALYGVDARRLTPEQRKQYRSLVLRLGTRIKAYLKDHPDEENGFWGAIPEYADEEIRDMMAKFKEPTT